MALPHQQPLTGTVLLQQLVGEVREQRAAIDALRHTLERLMEQVPTHALAQLSSADEHTIELIYRHTKAEPYANGELFNRATGPLAIAFEAYGIRNAKQLGKFCQRVRGHRTSTGFMVDRLGSDGTGAIWCVRVDGS